MPRWIFFPGDEDFERGNAQDLCISPYLDVSNMDLFKTVVDGQLVEMIEDSPKAEGSKGVTDDNSTSGAQENEHEI